VQIRIESDREKITGSIMFILLLIAISTLCIYLVYRAYLTNQLSKRLYSLAKDHYEHRDMFIATKLKENTPFNIYKSMLSGHKLYIIRFESIIINKLKIGLIIEEKNKSSYEVIDKLQNYDENKNDIFVTANSSSSGPFIFFCINKDKLKKLKSS